MIIHNIRYYGRLEYDNNSKTIPKYSIKSEAGYYEPMEQIKGRNGLVSMYLMEKLKEGANVPSMRLQAKNSLNFTGLKDYFVDGKLSGFAYGYPLADKVYSSKKIDNPFYEYRNDGFLFIVHQDKTAATYNPQIQISAESETKRSIFREKDKTKRSKKESAQHSKSRNKSFVMTSVSAL